MDLQSLKHQITSILSAVPGEYGFAIKTGTEIIQSNENIVVPAASTIKIPIMMEAFRQIHSGELKSTGKVQLEESQKVGGNGVLKTFSEGIALPLIDVIKLMIIVSDNTATNAVLRMVGIEKVNRLCESIGCINTRIERYLMDVKAKEKGKDNTTSAKDMLTLLEYMLKKSPYKKEMVTILENQQFSHKLAAYLTNEKLKIAHKTGELPGIEHDVGLFQYKNQVVYASVMLHELKDNVTGQQLIAQVGKVIMEFMVGRG